MSKDTPITPFNYSYVSSSGHSGYVDMSKGNTAPAPHLDPEENLSKRLDNISRLEKELTIEKGKAIEKGLQSDDPDIVMKANKAWEDVASRHGSEMKTVTFDPIEFRDSLGYKHKPTPMTYGVLRRMSQTPLVRAVITTRQAQVAEFATPQDNRFEPGFIIQKKKKFFSKDQEDVTEDDRERMNYLAKFLLSGGDEDNAWDGDTFEVFLKKLTEDSLVLDQATAEIVRNNFGKPTEFMATDGATHRYADSVTQEDQSNSLNSPRIRGYLPKYVQVIDGNVVNEYYPWELVFGIRNATTNIYHNGYGRSELEALIQIVTWMLYSDQYNGNFFSQGSSPKGFLKVAGNVNSNRIQEFRQQWMSMTAGVQNAHKVPIIESEKMEWIDLQQKNSDMQFAEWQEYLLKVICAVYKISPEELGFAVKQSGGLGDGGNTNDSKVKYSRDKGLKPLLRNIESWINKWIINPLDSEFEFKFVGLDIDTEKESLELDIKRGSLFMGLKELRRKNDLPEDLEEGDILLNPIWMQNQSMQAMQGDQEQSDAAAAQAGGGVWDNLDDEDVEFDEAEDTATKGTGNPFLDDLNEFTKGLFNEDAA